MKAVLKFLARWAGYGGLTLSSLVAAYNYVPDFRGTIDQAVVQHYAPEIRGKDAETIVNLNDKLLNMTEERDSFELVNRRLKPALLETWDVLGGTLDGIDDARETIEKEQSIGPSLLNPCGGSDELIKDAQKQLLDIHNKLALQTYRLNI